MNSLVQRIQPLLKNDEVCRYCIEGSLVSGWTRIPHFFAIVRSHHNNHGLIFFSYPGIGSTELLVKPKNAVPLDKNFRFMINNAGSNTPSSDVQLQLSSGSAVIVVEFATGKETEQFVSVLTDVYPDQAVDNTLFQWLDAYKEHPTMTNESTSNQKTTDNEILGQEIQLQQLKSCDNYTPIAFDADDDILSFDPLAPTKKKTTIAEPTVDPLSAVVTQRVRQGQEIDLRDFDPLSPDEIEESIKTDKMNADLLRRSREVVSNKAIAGKSWLERTFTNSSHFSSGNVQTDNSSETQHETTQDAQDTQEETFDVVDNLELQNVRNESSEPVPPLGSRGSSIFKGMRARENYIRQHLGAREKEFTQLFPFTVFAGTWNVNGQLASESLIPWLQSPEKPPDVYAIGFQELDLSAEALVFNDSSREDSWLKAIENGLPKSTHYFKLKQVRLVGMMLVVYVQMKHDRQVFDCEAETFGTGIMGMMGNKGGVAVRFQLHNSTICFVNSHLAAHLMEFERRNQDFREVYNKLKFTLFQPPITIRNHDMIFWLGDLNYRFDELDPDQVKALIEKKKYEKLYTYDQLNKQRKEEKVFNGFSEGPITFKPTYKYDPGSDQWDTSEKGRAPAWCDRVLWKGKNIDQLKYISHHELKLSDHKPVSSLFSVGIKVVDRHKEKKVFEEIVRKLDKQENDSLPQVKLNKQDFQFGNIQFMEEKTHWLPIINCGESSVEFEFIPKLDETEVSKPWIKVNPEIGFIYPGDLLEIELTVYVDKMSAPLITVGNCKIDEILVLHLVNGKDFFVPINGTYLPSVFGSSLEALVRVYGPIRQVPMDSLIRLESHASSFDSADGGVSLDDTEPLEIPKELWLLIDHLHKYGMKVENILLQSGTDEEIVKIRHHLDTGQGGKIPGSLYSIGEALLLFLEALPEPVIPYMFHQKCLDACNNYVLCKQIIAQLPECHSNVFRYLTSFLRELLRQNAENKLDPKMLAAVFGSILLRQPMKQSKNKRAMSQIAQKKSKFVFHFLVNDFRE